MFVMHINIKVKPEFVEEFKQICTDNAKNSINEPLIKRFDCLQQADEPTRFILVEAYENESGIDAHRKTAHYNKWKTEAERMMDGERTRTKFTPIWPEKY
jgi:quinol monooxygenase YgiN